MTYQVILTDYATRQLSKLQKSDSKKITDKLGKIRDNPFHFVRKLKEYDFYRLRVGDYRVIMSIDRGKLVILVIEIGHRKNIYKKH